jgi:hypothetical protein
MDRFFDYVAILKSLTCIDPGVELIYIKQRLLENPQCELSGESLTLDTFCQIKKCGHIFRMKYAHDIVTEIKKCPVCKIDVLFSQDASEAFFCYFKKQGKQVIGLDYLIKLGSMTKEEIKRALLPVPVTTAPLPAPPPAPLPVTPMLASIEPPIKDVEGFDVDENGESFDFFEM